MLFHSLDYLLFLPLVAFLHFQIPHRWRWLLLLTASYLFYASWRVEFLPLLMLSTLVDYLVARGLHAVSSPKWRKALLSVSVAVNLGLLMTFKYLAAGWLLVGGTLAQAGFIDKFTPLDIILPLGISFYIFQTLSYIIDVYRGRIEPERHLGYFATYVAYFPQLLAGPIERASQLLPRLRQQRLFSGANLQLGVGLILLGFFKKLVIADRLAQLIAPVAAQPNGYTAWDVVSVPPLLMYQYYCDLSGYADIALGSSLILGIRLAKNFARPFAATSVTNFWFRWHITVTLWFRDYLLLPLAGRRSSLARRAAATLVTGLLIGLWHGAALGWLVAGISAGTMALVENRWRKWRLDHQWLPRSSWQQWAVNGAGRLYVWIIFSFVIGIPVCFGSLEALAIAWQPIAAAWMGADAHQLNGIWNMNNPRFLVPGAAIVALELWQWLDERKIPLAMQRQLPEELIWLTYGLVALAILMFGVLDSTDFLYFKF